MIGLAPLLAAQSARITVDDPRPLWKAIRVLEERNGWQISYEDPKYSATDMVDRTVAGYSGPNRALVPRGGHLDIALRGNEPSSAAVQLLIDDSARRDSSLHFEVQSIGKMLVVGSAQGSPLDLPVSLPRKDRNLDEFIGDLVQALNQAGPIRVHGPGMLVGDAQRFPFSASNEIARNTLARAVQAITDASLRHPMYVWDLLYAGDYGYVLNIHTVKQLVSIPDGSGTKLIQVPAK